MKEYESKFKSGVFDHASSLEDDPMWTLHFYFNENGYLVERDPPITKKNLSDFGNRFLADIWR